MGPIYAVVASNNLDQQEDGSFVLKKSLKLVHATNDAAVAEANTQAATNPGVPFYVLKAVAVIEAVQPKITFKVWNERGELGVHEAT